MTVISPRRQLANSCSRMAKILFPISIPLIFLLIPAGCCYSCSMPAPEAEKTPLSSQGLQDESQITTSESPDSELAAALTAEATALFTQSLFQEAEEKFLSALEADPGHILALTGLSNLLTFAPERWQESLEYAELAHSLAPKDATVLSHLTWALLSAYRFKDAYRTAAAATAANPESALVQIAHADVAFNFFEYELALSYILKALEIDPFNARAYISYSFILQALHDWPAAKEAAAFAIVLEPDFHLWKPILGHRIFSNDGDPEAALDVAAPALQAFPNHPYVLSLVVYIASELNEWDKALEGCRQLVSLNSPETPYPDGYICLTNISISMEDYGAAESYQDQAEEVAWNDRLDISFNRVRLLEKAEECEQIRVVARKWLDDLPYAWPAQSWLGSSYMCSGNYEEAIHIREEIVRQSPTSVPDAYALALSYASNGMLPEAFKTLRNIEHFAQEDPIYYQAQYHLNLIGGDLETAIANAQKGVELRPCCAGPLEELAVAHFFNEDMTSAKEAAENAFAKGSTSANVTAILGFSYFIDGDIEAAEQMLLTSLDKDPEVYLAGYALFRLYLVTTRCEKGELYLNWLVEQETEEERKVALGSDLEECYQRWL